MSQLKELRENLNCSQEALCAYLKCRRTSIGMAEVNRRSLTSKALKDILLLVMPLQKKVKTKSESERAMQAIADEKAASRQTIMDRVEFCTYHLAQQMHKLELMKERYMKSCAALDNLCWIADHATGLTRWQMEWVTGRLAEEKENIQANGWSAQSLIELKIASLTAEVNTGNQLLQSI